MMDDRAGLWDTLRSCLRESPRWSSLLSPKTSGMPALHLAILREPYLQFVLEGKKTVETRFAKRACPPYQRVAEGDVVLLKRAGGEIVGICTVSKVWFYKLDPKSLALIKGKFGAAICPADDSFWEDRKDASVATLMLIENVARVEGVAIPKRDRRGWVVFKETQQQTMAL